MAEIGWRAIHQVANNALDLVPDDKSRRPIPELSNEQTHIVWNQLLANETVDLALKFPVVETMGGMKPTKPTKNNPHDFRHAPH